jgi:transposase
MDARVQLRNDTAGRAHYRRKLAEGKGCLGALRCLRQRISDAVYRQLLADTHAQPEPIPERAGPGGNSGATTKSSAADLTPVIGTSDQSLPGAAPTTLDPAHRSDQTAVASAAAPPADAPEMSRRSAPSHERT